jgi:hypothetical protein
MTDDERTQDQTNADTGAGEAVQETMPDPEEMPGGKTGRHEGEGKPGPKDPGTTRDVTGA